MSSGGRRFDVSALQVTASVLAAVTGAIAASYLGVAGTIVGTALMSVAGTAGSAFYRFYLGAGKERLRAKAVEIAPKTMDSSLVSALNRHRQEDEAAQALRDQEQDGAAGPGTAPAWAEVQRRAARADVPRQASGLHDDPTQLFPAVTDDPAGYRQDAGSGWPDRGTAAYGGGNAAYGGRDTAAYGGRDTAAGNSGTAAYRDGHRGGAHGTAAYGTAGYAPGGYGPGSGYGPDDLQATAMIGAGDPRFAEAGGDLVPGTAAYGHGRGRGAGRAPGGPGGSRPRWLRIALASLAVFAVTMTGITVFELVAGKPIEAVVYGRKATGTTIGHVVSPGSRHQHSSPAPGTSHRASHSPAPSATSPAPRASSTPSPTTSPTPSGSASPSASAPAQGPRSSSSPSARAGQ